MIAEIWRVIAEIGIEIHPNRVNAIANKVAQLSSVDEFCKLISTTDTLLSLAIMDGLNKAWRNSPDVSPIEVAGALRGASSARLMIENREMIEMVWTGPLTGLVPSRHTDQVLLEVIQSASKRLFVVSFVVYDVDSIFNALLDALNRNVQIDILLESSRLNGGKINVDSTIAVKNKLPAAKIYSWNAPSKYSEGLSGSVHAKCAVADGSIAFITSANLTRAAMEMNMELGVLIRGGEIPKNLEEHLDALISTEVIKRV